MTVKAVEKKGRFEWITLGRTRGPDPIFDHQLDESHSAVAIPSKGSLVAGWTLIVPRETSLNFARLPSTSRADAWLLAKRVSSHLEASFERRVFFFEHGPAGPNTAVGCGVDQAHLHAVPLDFDLISVIIAASSNDAWSLTDLDADPWTGLPVDKAYWLVIDQASDRRLIVYPNAPVSQGIRRLIAAQVGRDAQWDYRSYPIAENALQTIGALR